MLLTLACGVALTASIAIAANSGARASSTLVVAVPSLGSQNWTPWTDSSAEEIISHMVGDTLTVLDPKTGAVDPGLALSWKPSKDLKTWTFQLRPGVHFQGNYGTLTASDVKFTWGQFIQPTSTQGLASILRQAVNNDMANFQIINSLSFSVTARIPIAYLPAALSNESPGLVIQSQKYWAQDAADAPTHPLGTGPWQFVSSTPGVNVVLKATATSLDHFRQQPAYKTLNVKIISDDAARLAAVESGGVDMAPTSLALLGEAQAAKLKVQSVPTVGVYDVMLGGWYVGSQAHYDPTSPWIQASAPAKGKDIREAMSMAINRAALLSAIQHGQGKVVAAPLVFAPGDPWTDPAWKNPKFNLAQAKQLMAAGGYPNGFTINMFVFDQTGRPGTANLDQAVAGMWQTLGITVKLMPMDFPTFKSYTAGRTTAGDAYVFVTPRYTEPLQALQIGYVPGGSIGHFYDPGVTDSVNRMSLQPDKGRRFKLAEKLGAYLISEGFPIPLFTQTQPYVFDKKVSGWTPIPGLSELSNVETVTPAK